MRYVFKSVLDPSPIVEAMKLMNEITAEFDCAIVSVVCEDAKMVEYGQQLLKVKMVI